MTQPKISAEAWEQAISDYESECPDMFAGLGALLCERARELTAAQPAAVNDAMRSYKCKNCGYPVKHIWRACPMCTTHAPAALAADQKEKT